MINPGVYNVSCWQGADWDRTFTVSQNSVPLNLSGYSARMQVRESADADGYLLSLTDASGITLGGTAGTITVAITSAQSSAVAAGAYSYDLEIISNGGTVTRLLQGSFVVVGNVTR